MPITNCLVEIKKSIPFRQDPTVSPRKPVAVAIEHATRIVIYTASAELVFITNAISVSQSLQNYTKV